MTTLIGMTPQQALVAATGTAARLLRIDAGILAEGRPADLVLLDRDFADDVRALRAPRAVFKNGTSVRERA